MDVDVKMMKDKAGINQIMNRRSPRNAGDEWRMAAQIHLHTAADWS